MLFISSVSAGFTAPPAAPANLGQRAAVRMYGVADLEALAVEANPVVKFWDPLGFTQQGERNQYSESASIGWLRHAEQKHGRIAMMGFVGFIAQSNGIVFPWNLNLEGTSFADIAAAGGPASQWDALPTTAKLQILGCIGLLEFIGEQQKPHYMSGGVPGAYPKFADAGVPHPVPLNLFDPLGTSKKASPEKKAKGLIAEMNNGRLAMIGLMAFLSEARVPGSVPGLKGLVASYDGEVMAPFSSADAGLPFVSDMLNYKLSFIF